MKPRAAAATAEIPPSEVFKLEAPDLELDEPVCEAAGAEPEPVEEGPAELVSG